MVSTPNAISGRSAFIELLKSEGVTHLFGNPGTTELPIMHAFADYPEMRYVLRLQEAIVVAMADGYARASGEFVACNVHVAPGLFRQYQRPESAGASPPRWTSSPSGPAKWWRCSATAALCIRSRRWGPADLAPRRTGIGPSPGEVEPCVRAAVDLFLNGAMRR
jgi:hypothetical protein